VCALPLEGLFHRGFSLVALPRQNTALGRRTAVVFSDLQSDSTSAINPHRATPPHSTRLRSTASYPRAPTALIRTRLAMLGCSRYTPGAPWIRRYWLDSGAGGISPASWRTDTTSIPLVALAGPGFGLRGVTSPQRLGPLPCGPCTGSATGARLLDRQPCVARDHTPVADSGSAGDRVASCWFARYRCRYLPARRDPYLRRQKPAIRAAWIGWLHRERQ